VQTHSAKVFVELFSKSSPPEARFPCKQNTPLNFNLSAKQAEPLAPPVKIFDFEISPA
jgi:hypothetical protein